MAAVFNDDGDVTSAAGPWLPTVDDPPLQTSATTFVVSNLANGTTYDFAVGRVRDGVVSSWSSIPSATPLGGGVFDSTGTFTITATTLIETLIRAAAGTTLNLSSNWQYVVVDYSVGGEIKRHGATKTNGFSLPGGYTPDESVIKRISNSRVEILLGSSQELTLRVQGNGGSSFTMTLLTVA